MKTIQQKKEKKTAKSMMVLNYKDPISLLKYISDGGKIVPSRISKLKLSQQRIVNNAVKKARNLGLLPVGTDHFDTMGKTEQINPQNFDF